MKTKNVFLDAQAIIGQNFNYESPAMKALADLAKNGHAHLVTTPITIGEVESNIRSRVAKARIATDRFKSHAILKNLEDPALAPLLGKDDVLATAADELIKQLHDFIRQTNTETVSLSEASSDEVFKKYFKEQPPFGKAEAAEDDQEPDDEGGETKKKKKGKTKNRKNEFPDAFVISALENWCKKKGEKIYVVSTDSDIEEHCKQSENLIGLSRVGEVLHELDPDLRREAIEKSAQRNIEAFTYAVEGEFENLLFYLDDQNGDVNEVRVERVQFPDMLSLIGIVDNVATFEVTAKVNFILDVSYDDPESTISDSDGNYIALRRIDTELERSEEFTLTVDALLDEKGNFESISDVHFPPLDLAITARPADYYK